MRGPTQAEVNPFPFSDTNKRYHTYEDYLKHAYGSKCAKLTLDAGFTCPNIDGTRGYGGCIYCSARGSGDFSPSARLSLTEQYAIQREKIRQKWKDAKLIPYLQAHTNTYAPIERLRQIYREVLSLPDAVAVHIATRADCLSSEVLSLLGRVTERLPLTVELGLQTVWDETARRIGRGHTYEEFLDGYHRLREALPEVRVSVHLINGLPGEEKAHMLQTAETVASLVPHEVKLHLLHALRGTPLGAMYERGEYTPMTREEYVDVVVEQLRRFPPSTVIGRLTGDGKAEDLLAPLWSLKKLCVINEVDKKMASGGFFQGDLCKSNKK